MTEGEEKIFTIEDYPQLKQLCEDLKADPRFNITPEEATKRLYDSIKGMIGYKIWQINNKKRV